MEPTYTPEAMTLLADLPTWDKERFAAEKADYQRLVAELTKAFVAALGPRLAEAISPGITWQARTNGSIAPINNDLRFSPEASPYKDHLLLRFWEGADKRTAPTLFVRITADGVWYASGVAPADVATWRKVVASGAGDGIGRAAALAFAEHGATVILLGRTMAKLEQTYDAIEAGGGPQPAIFPMNLVEQEMIPDRWVDIPEDGPWSRPEKPF